MNDKDHLANFYLTNKYICKKIDNYRLNILNEEFKHDKVKLLNGDSQIVDIIKHTEETIVYNLQDIEGNHNFFANNVLVHNRFCFVAGTQITMVDGSFKNIEEVQIGDEVITLNEETKLNEVKKVIELSPGAKPNPYRVKAGGMSVGRRTLLTNKSEMIEL